MPRSSPYRIDLSDEERQVLESLARRYTSPYRDVVRARIVLLAAQGLRNDEIAARLDTPRLVVSKWRKRFHDQRLAGLGDLPRGGRPSAFPPEVVVAIKALACELPARLGVPLARLHVPDLRAEAIDRGIVADIGGTTIWRWLSADAIKPWRVRGWIFPREVLTPNDFTGLDEVAARLAAFERRYEQTAEPFEWKFTRHDLELLLNRLADKPDLATAA